MNYETDDNGQVQFKKLESGKYVVEARGESMKGVAKIDYDDQDTGLVSLDLDVVKPGAVDGQVYLPKGVSSVSVGVEGMEYRVQTDSTGKFAFKSLPAGELNMIAYVYDDTAAADKEDRKIVNYGSIEVELKSGKQEEVFIGDSSKMPKSFVFDDFENGVGNWYIFHSQYASGELDATDAGKDRDGKVAHFVCENDSNANWVLMGATLEGSVDMSELDSIVFWARAAKTKPDMDKLFIHFSFDVVADSVAGTEEGKAWGRVDIDSVWTRYVVTPGSLMEPDSQNTGGNIGWDAVKSHVNKLSIFGGTGGEFWIDDIEVYGLRRFNVVEPAKKED